MPNNRYVLAIYCIHGGSLLALAIALCFGARSFGWQALPFVLALAWAGCRGAFEAGGRGFLAGCTLLILLLPFGDLFILAAIPLALYYLFIKRREVLALCLPRSPLAYLWAGFIALGFITGFWARSPLSAWAMGAALLGFTLVFILGRVFTLDEKSLLFLSDVFTGILPITLCFVFFHLALGRPISILGIGFSADTSSASFISDWSANAAGFLVVSFILIFVRFLRVIRQNKGDALGTGLALAVVFVGILATQTRMVFFFFAGSGLVFLIFYPWNFLRRSRFFLAALPLALIPLLGLVSSKWKATLENPLAQTSFVDRWAQLVFGVNQLKEGHLWQGLGLFNFRLYYNPSAEAAGLPRVEFLHNMYASAFVETGILGGLLFTASLGVLLWSYLARQQQPRFGGEGQQPRAYAGMLLLAGIACHNLTDNWLYVLKFSLLSFFLLGYFYPEKPSKG